MSTATYSDGWRVPAAGRAASLIVAIPAAVLGFLLTISFWFMAAGAPLLASAGCSIRAVRRADRRGAPHPALFVSILAATEFVIGLLGWSVLPRSAGRPIAAAFTAASAITALIGWNLWRNTTPIDPPPAPRPPMKFER